MPTRLGGGTATPGDEGHPAIGSGAARPPACRADRAESSRVRRGAPRDCPLRAVPALPALTAGRLGPNAPRPARQPPAGPGTRAAAVAGTRR
ncbi:hypothetical protein GCM10010421_58250 [Streptomyces glaucus]|uniref:Secreted protein n=1 Tax=Streptomyces glaucus TaxID=284029 RepID=A0ABN3KH40_9ACTN